MNACQNYSLTSELVKLSLAGAFKDKNRKLAFANSICLAVLIVGIFGLKQPESKFKKVASPIEIVPVVYVPPKQPEKKTTKPDRLKPLPETVAEILQVVSVVTPDFSDMTFPIPIKGPVVIAKFPQASTIPPRPIQTSPVLLPNPNDGITRPRLDYPSEAKRNRVQGTTLLEVVVAKSGSPTMVKIANSSGHSVLDDTAVEWAKKWLWPAGEVRYYLVPIDFKLR